APLVRDVAAVSGRAYLDLCAGKLGRRGEDERADVATDVQHHRSLAGARVLQADHRSPPGVPGSVVKPLFGLDRYGNESSSGSPYGVLSSFVSSFSLAAAPSG